MNQELEKTTSTIAGIPIELIEPRPGLWIATPVNRKLLRSKLWLSLRTGPSSGIGSTPLEAALLLCTSVGACGIKKVAPRHKAKKWIRKLLSNGVAQEVAQLKKAAMAEGLTWSSVDRAARELCIERVKCGFRDGWRWQMLNKCEGL